MMKGRSSMKRLTVLFVFMFATHLAHGWIGGIVMWQYLHIARVNYANVEPTENYVAPEATGISLPVTITVRSHPGVDWDFDVQHMELQYRVVGETFEDEAVWHTFGPVYDILEGTFSITGDQMYFGRNSLHAGLENVDPGDEILVRIYIKNNEMEYENASKTADTTAEGTNGWRDEWVVSITTVANTRPVWGPVNPW